MYLNSSPPTGRANHSGIFLRVVDQLGHGLERRAGRHCQQHVAARHQCNRLKIALDVVGQLRHHVARDRERADRPHADGVTVRLGLCRQIEPDREGAAGPVVDDDLLAELLAEFGAKDARDRVGCAARRLRHDQPDRLVGIFGGGREREHSGQQQQGGAEDAHEVSPDFAAA
jgi:hypothetical protein